MTQSVLIWIATIASHTAGLWAFTPCSYLVFFVLYYKFQTEFFSAWTYGPRVKHIGHKSTQKKKKRIFHNLQYGLRKQVIHLTPMSDQDRISPHHINTISSRQVMQIKRNINQGMVSWSKTKFSKLTSQEPYGRQ